MIAVALTWVLAVLVAPAPAAYAAGCYPAGGEPITRSAPASDKFVVVGGGYGHGVGMSQYGARGAALLGCRRSQILSTYYPGTTQSTALPSGMNNIRVSVLPSGPTGALPSAVAVQAVSANVSWRLAGVAKRQPAGETWRANVSARGRYKVTRGRTTIFARAKGPLRIKLGRKVVRLPAKNRRYNRGTLLLTWAGHGRRTFVTNSIGSMDRYLYGLAEMPSSWPKAALQAQAIAGRTYALSRREARNTGGTKWNTCRCDVYDSVMDQVYAAYEWESVAPTWVAAVDATRGRTLRYGGKTITAFYHSSSGGHVESSAFVFGGALPYSQAFDDSRWERASGNPNTTWVRSFTGAQIGNAFGVGAATTIRTPAPKGASGRIGEPTKGAGGVVIGSDGATKKVSGPVFRSALGLPSTLFVVQPPS